MILLATLAGATCGLGLCLLLATASGRLSKVWTPLKGSTSEGPGREKAAVHRLLVHALRLSIPAAVVGLVTGWPVAAILSGVAGEFVPRLFGATATVEAAGKSEAIAAWTEMLRDSLAAAAGLSQAIVVTAHIAPQLIAQPVRALAARIEAGVPLPTALRQFATDVDEPGADLVTAALVLASEQRAQKLGDLLGSLASATREEVSMRLRVDSSRARVRTSVRVVAGFSVGFAAFLAVVARGYLAPFGSPGGQMVLLLVGVFYAGGLWLMLRMARSTPFPRLDLRRAGT